MIRPSFTLGGTGGSFVHHKTELDEALNRGLQASPIHEVLVEKAVLGWKEFELELLRFSRWRAKTHRHYKQRRARNNAGQSPQTHHYSPRVSSPPGVDVRRGASVFEGGAGVKPWRDASRCCYAVMRDAIAHALTAFDAAG